MDLMFLYNINIEETLNDKDSNVYLFKVVRKIFN